MTEFCGEGCYAICDFCSHFRPDRPYSDEEGECESGICEATGRKANRSGGAKCDDFKCFRIGKAGDTP